MNHQHLPAEHAHHLAHSLLTRIEADIHREILLATTRPPATPRLGHSGAHTPKLALADYLAAESQPPERVHRGIFRGYTDPLANDQVGDCGEAMALHAIEGMHHAAGTRIPPFTAGDAIALYEQVAGYQPGNPATDQGTDNQTLIDWWTTSGVTCAADDTRHQIAGTVWIDPDQEIQNKIAIHEFGCLFRAINLPITAQGQREWQLVGDGATGDSAPGSWGAHDIPYLAYDPDSYDCDTWGCWTPASRQFDQTYALQGFAVITRDMLSRHGTSPTGLDWTHLLADLQTL